MRAVDKALTIETDNTERAVLYGVYEALHYERRMKLTKRIVDK